VAKKMQQGEAGNISGFPGINSREAAKQSAFLDSLTQIKRILHCNGETILKAQKKKTKKRNPCC